MFLPSVEAEATEVFVDGGDAMSLVCLNSLNSRITPALLIDNKMGTFWLDWLTPQDRSGIVS